MEHVFAFECLNDSQRKAREVYQKHDIIFMMGASGSGKSFLSTAFALEDIKSKAKDSLIICRPAVEAGEHLGFLPGGPEEKLEPYMLPIKDGLDKLLGKEGPLRERFDKKVTVRPLAYMRGLTFTNSVCILDEAQNATLPQIKMFLTRMGKGSKMIVAGDETQTDLARGSGLVEAMKRLSGVKGIGIVKFTEEAVVRHPLVVEVIKRL